MKRLLVTGGAGFIGSNFIRHILATHPGYHVTNLDKLTYCGNLGNLKDIAKNPRYRFVKGDIADVKIADRLVGTHDAVVNFAAETHVDRSIYGPEEFVKTNILGTQVLLEAARRHGVGRFVQISTDEVYGSVARGSSREGDALEPNSPYSASKAGADLLARSYFVTFKVPVIVTRSSNNFGPFQYPEKVIPLFVSNLLDGKKVPLYGDGKNKRDWLFVLDNCEALDAVLHRGNAGEIYNIGAGREITNLELTHAILGALGKPRTMIEYVKDRPGHDRRYALDISKAKALGWRPRRDFREALELTVRWYRDNEAWWRGLVACRKEIRY